MFIQLSWVFNQFNIRYDVLKEILCPEPPKVDYGMIQEKQNSYAYGQSVTYKCMEGFTLHGESSIYCTVKDDQGEWRGPLPQCRGNQFAKLQFCLFLPLGLYMGFREYTDSLRNECKMLYISIFAFFWGIDSTRGSLTSKKEEALMWRTYVVAVVV